MPSGRVLLIAAAVLGVLAAGPAGADTGRVAFSVGLPSPADNVDVTGATAAVARPDGGAILVGDEPGRGIVAAAIDADGALARPGIQGSGGNCDPAALSPDGSLVLTGNTGAVSPEIGHDPDAPVMFTWVVTRLAPDGRPDGAFGTRHVPGTGRGDSGGYGAAVAAD